MKLTVFSDVSLRVLMLLSVTERGHRLSTQMIAEQVGTPYNHVAKSVVFLASHGWVDATRGRTGGVVLSEAGRTVTVGQVLRASEKRTALVECASHSPQASCPLVNFCSLHTVLTQAREAFYEAVDDVVVSTLPQTQHTESVTLNLGTGPLAEKL